MKKIITLTAIISILILITVLSGCISDTSTGNISQENELADADQAPLNQPTGEDKNTDVGVATEPPVRGDNLIGPALYLAYYEEGINLSRNGSHDDAVAAFTSSVNANISFTEAYFERGKANYELGRRYSYEGKQLEYFKKARDDFSTVIQRDPSHEDALAMRGWSNYWIGEYYFERIYEMNSTISSYFEQGIDDCTRALAINPKNTHALNGRALNYLNRVNGNHLIVADPTYLERAKSDIDTSLKINSTNPWAYYALGMYYYRQRGFTLSLDAHLQAINLDPDEAWFYLYAQKAATRTEDKQIAYDLIKKATELQPMFAAAHNNIGLSDTSKAPDNEGRLAGYERAIEIDPTVAIYYRNYAVDLWNLKWWDRKTREQVLNILDKALEVDPSYYQIHADKALILIYCDRNDESTIEMLKFQKHAKTNEDFAYAEAVLNYNGRNPWKFNL